ncbi:MAG: IS200/IS605 family transposase [Pyrinomonadaceae bacterium]|nr:IS200/IS605 family transposase [Pyrinomonadaceae bacterium]
MLHTHLLYHIIFATKDRLPMIQKEWQADLHAYLGGIVKNLEGVPIEINGVSDHIHILVRLQPKIALSDFMRELKASSSGWIRRTHYAKFAWQARYGAFTVSESQVQIVRNYIKNQEKHHQAKNFVDEYKDFLTTHKIDFEEKYLWN